MRPWWASVAGAIKERPGSHFCRQPGPYAVRCPPGRTKVPTPHAVTGWCAVSVIRYRHGPAPVRSRLVASPALSVACSILENMTRTDPSHTSSPPPPGDAQPPVEVRQPPADPAPVDEPYGLELSPAFKERLERHYLNPGETVDQVAAAAAARRAGHTGLHHYAGHASGRSPWRSCGEWRPRAGVTCPVCPQVCPGCGSHYVNPFPVDPRDG